MTDDNPLEYPRIGTNLLCPVCFCELAICLDSSRPCETWHAICCGRRYSGTFETYKCTVEKLDEEER